MPDTIEIYGASWCPDCRRAQRFLGAQGIVYQSIDVDKDPRSAAFVEKLNSGMRVIPTIVFPDGSVLSEPTNAQLAQKLGLRAQAQPT